MWPQEERHEDEGRHEGDTHNNPTPVAGWLLQANLPEIPATVVQPTLPWEGVFVHEVAQEGVDPAQQDNHAHAQVVDKGLNPGQLLFGTQRGIVHGISSGCWGTNGKFTVQYIIHQNSHQVNSFSGLGKDDKVGLYKPK